MKNTSYFTDMTAEPFFKESRFRVATKRSRERSESSNPAAMHFWPRLKRCGGTLGFKIPWCRLSRHRHQTPPVKLLQPPPDVATCGIWPKAVCGEPICIAAVFNISRGGVSHMCVCQEALAPVALGILPLLRDWNMHQRLS